MTRMHVAPEGAARSPERRSWNERLALRSRHDHAEREAQVPFRCECSDESCDEVVALTLDRYALLRRSGDYLVAPGHEVENARIARIRGGCWLYRSEAA